MQRRLSEDELNDRIESFLTRKYAEFPELVESKKEAWHAQPTSHSWTHFFQHKHIHTSHAS
jgi:hypothetical protein